MSAGFHLAGLAIRDRRGAAIVQDIGLAAAPGEAVVVIGETGSGKSLIALAMLGLLPPSFSARGTLTVAGHGAADLSQPGSARALWARGVGWLPQEPGAALDPTMRVGRQLGGAGRAAAMLRAVGLAPSVGRAYPFALSGGMAQRALVATLLGVTASTIVVDEPTKGLDPDRVGQVVASLRTLLAAGRSLLVITHDTALARSLPGRVAVLCEGRIAECRPAADLFARPGCDYTARWIAADPARWPAPAPAGGGAPVLSASGLAFAYRGGPTLFGGVDVAVCRGGVVALSGPSGSGKTTLGNILVGLSRPGAGSVDWAGVDPFGDRVAARRKRRRYQKLHQDPASALVPHRSIRRQLADLAEIVPGLRLEEALPPMLDRLGLRPALLDRLPGEISGGEAQRLALARLLLLEPELIVADEPTSRLDPITQRETIQLLRDVLRDRGIGLVLISHNRALVDALTGDVVQLGTVISQAA